jgi:hypothetical protein
MENYYTLYFNYYDIYSKGNGGVLPFQPICLFKQQVITLEDYQMYKDQIIVGTKSILVIADVAVRNGSDHPSLGQRTNARETIDEPSKASTNSTTNSGQPRQVLLGWG